MNIFTQISGRCSSADTGLGALRYLFAQLGIDVTYPIQSEPLFYAPSQTKAWEDYNTELYFYESIANSTFHIVYHKGWLDEVVCRELLYAILRDRPILMTGLPLFKKTVSSITKQLITKHMNAFYLINLYELELVELDQLLRKLNLGSYRLSSSERLLINTQVKAHFRTLLEAAKQAD